MKEGVVVTGAGGFIGQHLIESLLAQGQHIVALQRPASVLPKALLDRVQRVECCDWTAAGIASVLRNQSFRTVYHLAAYGVNPSERAALAMLHVNAVLPTIMVRLCSERGASLILAGSSAEYAEPEHHTPLQENAPLETGRVYGASKAIGGLSARALANDLGVSLCLLRLFHVYGTGEAPHRLLSSIMSAAANGSRVSLSAGAQVRDFVYVKDVIGALLSAETFMRSSTGPVNKIWNVCTGSARTVHSFVNLAAGFAGLDADLLGFGDVHMRSDETPWLVGDPSRIRNDLRWQPEFDLESGLRRAVQNWAEGETHVREGSTMPI